MLVLTRFKGEEIYVGDNIRITVVDIRGDRARIGIEAPRTVPVHRAETREQILHQYGVNHSGARCPHCGH
jgi:carbon storage regulator